MKRLTVAALAALALFVLGCGVSSPRDTSGPGTKDLPITTGSASATSTPAAVQEGVIVGDGKFAVPSQVKPATYKTVVPAGGHCYWARLSAADGEFTSIIANDNLGPGDQGIVTIKASDKYFETNGCGRWTKV